jgi:hypothetical protein
MSNSLKHIADHYYSNRYTECIEACINTISKKLPSNNNDNSDNSDKWKYYYYLALAYQGLEDIENAKKYFHIASKTGNAAEPLYQCILLARRDRNNEEAYQYILSCNTAIQAYNENPSFTPIWPEVYQYLIDYQIASIVYYLDSLTISEKNKIGLESCNNILQLYQLAKKNKTSIVIPDEIYHDIQQMSKYYYPMCTCTSEIVPNVLTFISIRNQINSCYLTLDAFKITDGQLSCTCSRYTTNWDLEIRWEIALLSEFNRSIDQIHESYLLQHNGNLWISFIVQIEKNIKQQYFFDIKHLTYFINMAGFSDQNKYRILSIDASQITNYIIYENFYGHPISQDGSLYLIESLHPYVKSEILLSDIHKERDLQYCKVRTYETNISIVDEISPDSKNWCDKITSGDSLSNIYIDKNGNINIIGLHIDEIGWELYIFDNLDRRILFGKKYSPYVLTSNGLREIISKNCINNNINKSDDNSNNNNGSRSMSRIFYISSEKKFYVQIDDITYSIDLSNELSQVAYEMKITISDSTYRPKHIIIPKISDNSSMIKKLEFYQQVYQTILPISKDSILVKELIKYNNSKTEDIMLVLHLLKAMREALDLPMTSNNDGVIILNNDCHVINNYTIFVDKYLHKIAKNGNVSVDCILLGFESNDQIESQLSKYRPNRNYYQLKSSGIDWADYLTQGFDLQRNLFGFWISTPHCRKIIQSIGNYYDNSKQDLIGNFLSILLSGTILVSETELIVPPKDSTQQIDDKNENRYYPDYQLS